MTYVRDVYGNELFDRFFVGSDRVVKQLNDLVNNAHHKASNYPPYNIKRVDHNRYVVEIAVAGFSDEDIDITVEDGKLTVKGKLESVGDLVADGIDQVYLYKGISDRAFTRQFTLADNVEVKDANLANGMLKIYLEAIIPDHKKPRKITIGYTDKKLLTE